MNTDLLIMASANGTIQAFDAQNSAARWQWHSAYAFSGAALARVADHIIAVALDGALLALSIADGALLWEAHLPDVAPLGAPPVGLRVIANEDRLVVQFGGCYFGIDPLDGHVQWISGSTPAVQGPWLLGVGQQYAYVLEMDTPPPSTTDTPDSAQPARSPHAWIPPSFVTTSLSTWDGSIQNGWRDQSAVPAVWDGPTSLVETDGILYIYGHGLHAFDAASHHLLWTNDTVPSYDVAVLAVTRNQVIVAAGSHLGAYRRDTGAQVWSETGQHHADGYFEVFNGLVVLGDVVYVGRGHNAPGGFQIEAREAETGVIRWLWPTGQADSTRLRFDISWRFCGAGETLYVPSLNTVWGIRASDGAQRWSHAYTSMFDAFLAIAASDPAC